MDFINAFRSIFDSLTDVIFPPFCISCKALIPKDSILCESCESTFDLYRKPHCAVCGRTLFDCSEADAEETYKCNDCIGKSFYFEQNMPIYVYGNILRKVIHGYKYGYHPMYGQVLGRLIHKHIDHGYYEGVNALIPVPLHKSKLRKRGYNQAELMATELGKRLGIPVYADMIVRTRATRKQSGLGAEARRINIADAFALNKIYLNHSINSCIIVDDIYTTGSTLSACAQILKQHGVDHVKCLTLSAAQTHEDDTDDDIEIPMR